MLEVYGDIEICGKELPIGVFDSGLGGLHVLAECARMMPEESFLYYADTLHNPYGNRTEAEINALVFDGVGVLTRRGVKAVVIACNTATSASIEALRHQYNFPVVGIEPAVKPAAEYATECGGKVLVLATAATARQSKFCALTKQYSGLCQILVEPQAELAALIEGHFEDLPFLSGYLETVLTPKKLACVAAVVLGCTHYSFLASEIAHICKKNGSAYIRTFDGSTGVARRVRSVLCEASLQKQASALGRQSVACGDSAARIKVTSSAPEAVPGYRRILSALLTR